MPTRGILALLCATGISLPAMPAVASSINGDYAFTVLAQTRALAQNDRYSASVMLEDGSVATIVRGGNFVNSPPDRIRVTGPDGSIRREITAPGRTRFGTGNARDLSVNESGQIAVAAFRESGTANGVTTDARRRLMLIEPDDTVRILIDSPAIQPSGVADATLTSFS